MDVEFDGHALQFKGMLKFNSFIIHIKMKLRINSLNKHDKFGILISNSNRIYILSRDLYSRISINSFIFVIDDPKNTYSEYFQKEHKGLYSGLPP
jgi:hypothetical protein